MKEDGQSKGSLREKSQTSLVCRAAVFFGLISAAGTFLLGIRDANVETAVDLAFGLGFSFWSGLPFLTLGYAKVLRRSPGFLAVLLLLGLGTMIKMDCDVFFSAAGSTAALGLISGPAFLLLVYGLAALWLSL